MSGSRSAEARASSRCAPPKLPPRVVEWAEKALGIRLKPWEAELLTDYCRRYARNASTRGGSHE